jgi:hypothetical protein
VDIVLIDGIFQFAGDELVLVDIVRPDNERREERILTDRLDGAPNDVVIPVPREEFFQGVIA